AITPSPYLVLVPVDVLYMGISQAHRASWKVRALAVLNHHRRGDLPAAEESVGDPAAAHFEGASFAERQVVCAGHLDDIRVVEAIRTALRNAQVLVHPA